MAKTLKQNTFFSKTLKLSALITESAPIEPVKSAITSIDDIVNIVGEENITNRNDKVFFNIAKQVGAKLHSLKYSRKYVMCCTIPVVKFVLEGNCKYINANCIMIYRVVDRIVHIATINEKNHYLDCGGITRVQIEDKFAGKRIEDYLRKRYKVKVGIERIERTSGLIADFVISQIEITSDTINFMLCQLFNTSNVDRAISRKRVFIDIALCTAVKIKNLGGDRRVMKSVIFSILESIESDKYAKVKIDARKTNLISESLAKVALQPSESNFYERKQRVSRLICDFFASKSDISGYIVDSFTYELANISEHKDAYLYVRSYVLVALLSAYKVKKMKGSRDIMRVAALDALDQIDLQSTAMKFISMDEQQIYHLANSIAESAVDSSVITQMTTATATSDNTKVSKKAMLAKEVEFLTTNIVRTVIQQHRDDDDITTSSIDYIIDEFIKHRRHEKGDGIQRNNTTGSESTVPTSASKVRKVKNVHRTFIELSMHAAMAVKKKGGDVFSISAAVASILSCRRFKNYRSLDVSPQMLKLLAINTANQVL